MKRFTLSLAAALLASTPGFAQQPQTESFRERGVEDEVIYFVLPDRFANGDTANDLGGYVADPLVSGFDPSHKGFYHGGDLKGLTEKLDYIQGMGVTAIWFAPIFKNKPVQGDPGNPGSFSSGYHGYWVTDFTQVDPHFGTNDEFAAFVAAAHARGMKVYMDIIANHTADVIRFAEDTYDYRSKGEYPYSTRGGVDGERINQGFDPADPSPENWAKLTDPTFAYTPVVPEAERNVKVPAWLNDPIYYHNRGDTFWIGESSTYGDFVGLDDLATENPRVVAGMIDIFDNWIDDFGIDGFRIDLAGQTDEQTLRWLQAELGDDVLIYGEPWIASNDPDYEANPSWDWYKQDSPITFFQDDARNAFKGTPLDDPTPAPASRGFSGGDPAMRDAALQGVANAYAEEATPNGGINYLDIHDNWALADRFAACQAGDCRWDGRQGVRDAEMRIAATLLLTSLGPVVLHGGTEFAKSKGLAPLAEEWGGELRLDAMPLAPIYLKGRGDTYNLRAANAYDWSQVGADTPVDRAAMLDWWSGLDHLQYTLKICLGMDFNPPDPCHHRSGPAFHLTQGTAGERIKPKYHNLRRKR